MDYTCYDWHLNNGFNHLGRDHICREKLINGYHVQRHKCRCGFTWE